MKYTLTFAGFSPQDIAEAGSYYDCANANDYLPGYQGVVFSSAAEAETWIAEHHRGPDCEGVSAIVTTQGAWDIEGERPFSWRG